MIYKAEIPIKMPSLNEYITECRRNKFAGAKFKRHYEDVIALYTRHLPHIKKPVKIQFVWVEASWRRDLDNVSFGKKFILDALVKQGVLIDDGQRFVVGLADTFQHDKFYAVKIYLEEVQ